MPGNKEIYDHLCFSLGWIFSSGGQYHGELPEIHYCNAAGSGGDCRQQRTLSSTQEAYVVSMNLGADDGDDDDDDADDAAAADDDAGWEGKKEEKKRKEKKKGGLGWVVASHIPSDDERVTEPRCARSPPKKIKKKIKKKMT